MFTVAACSQAAKAVVCILAALAMADSLASEHSEFDAYLLAPYRAAPAGPASAARTFTLYFAYPEVSREQAVAWQLDLLSPFGKTVRHWSGARRLFEHPLTLNIQWDGRIKGRLPPAGNYRLRLRATARDAGPSAEPKPARRKPGRHAGELPADPDRQAVLIEQQWDIGVGPASPSAIPAFQPLPGRVTAAAAGNGPEPPAAALAAAASAADLPYTVYYGNLHSHSNHSDGGGALATCHGAQAPQHGAYGPADAYAYALGHGLDFLVTSEHNHLYDGSDGTDALADPAAAKALYHSGLAAAQAFNAAHEDFLAVYGDEWGVIKRGGHLNIFNGAELPGWEYNAEHALLADVLTPKGDYAALYTLMRERGWLGQFNHPAPNGQFRAANADLGYTADGDQVMALCEVMNSAAFSSNTSETEVHRSNYEAACNKALEAGYHLAFSSDQDNHCANWGASYGNRTGLLIPQGMPLTPASLIQAIRARRLFATMDKHGQLVLTANGHLMGERFGNSGPLRLTVHFANTAGRRAASLSLMEGVPGRNGTVSLLSSSADTTVTPAAGAHFYYARLVQDDGNILWSAPLWVDQAAEAAVLNLP
ncbi:MAG TPA: CehA/McbA family metallohydrolase [Janthinobacterium sp.]|nr:CehA/McbA family metallohydrolase [Janthinobacterium sp.]